MSWRHPADGLPTAHAHQPHTAFLPARDPHSDGAGASAVPSGQRPSPTEPDGAGETGAGGTVDGDAGRESQVRRRDSVAVRAACSCQWRGPSQAITQQGAGQRSADIDREVETLQRRRLQGQWESHLRQTVATLPLYLLMPHVRYLDAELAGAVEHARRHEVSWASIAAACSRPSNGVTMSRQAAQQRWGARGADHHAAGSPAPSGPVSSSDRSAPSDRGALSAGRGRSPLPMPVVTGWPSLPGWTHPAAQLDVAAGNFHQPRTVWVQNSGGESGHRTRASTALRPGCGCGWRGSPRPAPDEPPSRMPDAVAGLERGFGPEWGRHLYRAVATLRIREVLDLMVGVHAELDAAVAHARAGHATWQDIADVLGIRRQSAHQRWRHLDHAPSQRAALDDTARSTEKATPSVWSGNPANRRRPGGEGPRQTRTVPALVRTPTER